MERTIQLVQPMKLAERKLLRVAAYARVSCDKDMLIEQSYCEERLARTILDRAIVQADKSISFVFRDGYTCIVDHHSI